MDAAIEGMVEGTRRPARRAPRPGELRLMRGLLDGPRRVTAGPIGRCVKRGWCRPLIVDPAQTADGEAAVLYALTMSGRVLVLSS